MPRVPETPTKQALIDLVGFLKVIELHPDFLAKFSLEAQGIDRLMIMPDVNSLHAFWQEKDSYWHQIIDYPYPDQDQGLERFLEFNLGQWSEGEVEGDSLKDVALDGGYIYKWADHLGEYVTWWQLESKYRKLKSAFRLLDFLGA